MSTKSFFLYDPKLLLYGFFFTFFASYGQTFFISIFNTEIRNFYNLNNSEYGLIYFAATICSSFLFIWFARLIDKINLLLYSLMICSGLALACLGMFFLIDFAFFLFIIIFLLRFFGQGAMGHASQTTMTRYFFNHKGKAISVGSLGAMFGFMFFPILTVYLMKNFEWKFVWLLSFFSIIFFLIPLIIFLLNNQKLRHKKFKDMQKENNITKNLKTSEVISDKKFYIYLPISICLPFITTGLVFHQIFIINQKGWNLDILAESFVFLGFFSIIGLAIAGPIIDIYRPRKIISFSLLPIFFSILSLIFFDNQISIFLYMSLIGLNMGIIPPFIGSLWAELYGLDNLGSIKALLHACGVFSTALSPLIYGYIIDLGFGVIFISITSLVIILLSSILTITYRNIS